MAIHRVFIFWTHPLFFETVRALLNHPSVECVGSSQDYSTGWDLVSDPPPDTIVIEEDGRGPQPETIKLLITTRLNVRVLGLNLLDNEIRVFDYSQRTAWKSDDLLHWILEDCAQKEKDK
jgi:DNA-binding NarL/FixJ family response regulator